MLNDIIDVKVIKDYIINILFENGIEGKIDISEIIPFQGIFAKLKDKKYFATVHVNKDLGTIVWDNGADISPNYLYEIISPKKS
jgi:hypothetical protein